MLQIFNPQAQQNRLIKKINKPGTATIEQSSNALSQEKFSSSMMKNESSGQHFNNWVHRGSDSSLNLCTVRVGGYSF